MPDTVKRPINKNLPILPVESLLHQNVRFRIDPLHVLRSNPISFIDQLGIANPEYYFYLNQSGCYTVDDTNDQKDFNETMEAMEVIGKSIFLDSERMVFVESLQKSII